MNVFDIIGPVMTGPSGSHTAGAVNAVTSVELTMAVIVSKIPADDVFSAMDNISKNMSDNIKETAEGGLAKTATGIRIAEEIL
jgi:L-serine dehydratase